MPSDPSNSDPQVISQLVSDLHGDDGVVRQKARHQLVQIGEPAVAAIAELHDSQQHIARWECAKTLAAIASPSSIDTLVKLLEDSDKGTAWDAAMGLIAIGKPAAAPVLHAIIARAKDHDILEAAHHVMHEMSKNVWGEPLHPVYKALHSSAPGVDGPVKAYEALKAFED